MALDHRLPAIFTAVFSSVAVLMAAFSGASCNFLERITSDDNDNGDFENEIEGISGSFGVLCEHELFPREGDKMWELSRIFLIMGLSLGSLTAALAWAVASFLTPTGANWNGISALAALTAVIQVPIFLLFESEPCMEDLQDIDGNFSATNTGLGCKLGPASYLLIASDLLFISVTLITQCLDRPRWGLELDLWKVHKKGESKSSGNRKRSSKAARNDEYYYDENENYDDDVHLTSRKARSIVGSSEGDDLNAFYKISRILPAGEANHQSHQEEQSEQPQTTKGNKNKKLKEPLGFFSRLFHRSRSSSLAENMMVPMGETQSMSGDEEYDYENQLLHELEIVRVLPQQENIKQTTAHSPPTTLSESGEGHEVSIGYFHNRVSNEKEAVNRSFQSFNAVIDEGGNANANGNANTNAIANTNANALKPWKYACVPENAIVEQHQMIDSPSASFISMESNAMPKKPAVVSSVRDILQDLHCEEMVGSAPHQSEPRDFAASCVPQQEFKSPTAIAVARSSSSGAPPAASDTIVEGVRKLTKKLKSADSTRQGMKSSLRNLNNIFHSRKGGYCQMNSDQSSNDDDDEDSEDNYFNYYNGTDVKPPPGLQLLYTQGSFHSENETPVNQSTLTTNTEGVQEDEIKHIYDELDQIVGDDNSIQEMTEVDKADMFDCISIGSTHSDPGPISFGSNEGSSITDFTPFFTSGEGENEQSTSFTDLFKVNTEEDIPWDNDFSTNEGLSQTTGDDDYDDSSEEPSRGRSSERNNDAPRRRRPISPVGSIKSHCSLLHMTIDEETEEDVKNELLDPKTTTAPYNKYALKRTLSSPEFRSVVGPISTRRDKSTNELLKKLERLKRSINVEGNSDSSRSDLPPRTPNKASHANRPESSASPSQDESLFAPMNESDDSSAMLSELLKAEPANQSKEPQASPTNGANSATVPAKLETSNSESWKEIISPMKDRPSKEPWKSIISPIKDTPGKDSMMDATVDISDETSETGYTRSTISYDSDDSSAGGHETGPRQIRSKSVGRAKKLKNNTKHYRASNSLSPTRRKTFSEGGSSSCLRSGNISSLARESRIRRLQQLRKGYMPLENEHLRAESPKPYRREPYASYDPSSDSELTPKRKTAGANEKDEIMSTTSSDLPDTLFQPSLLADPEESCPEFDDILNHLDLQLIDLNRPMGAEYGDEEGSM
jgi:hypothetical protein